MGKRLNFTLTGKIVCLIVLTALIVGGAAFGSALYFLSRGYDEQAESGIALTAGMVQAKLADMQENVRSSAASLAGRPDVATAIEKRDTAYLQNLGKNFTANEGLDFVTIADGEGKVIARSHSDQTGDSVANQINVKRALAGETSAGMEEGTVVKLSLRAGAPVRIDGRIVGTVTPGINLTSTNSFVDSIKKIFGVECTIFNRDERVSTTLEKDGKRIVGTKMDNPAVIETVLGNGKASSTGTRSWGGTTTRPTAR